MRPRHRLTGVVLSLLVLLSAAGPAAAVVPPFTDIGDSTFAADIEWLRLRWDDEALNQLKRLRGSDFEVVDTSGFVNGS